MRRLVYIINDCEATLFIVGDGYEERVQRR